MEVSGKFHAPDALPSEKEHPEAGWALEPVGTRWRTKIPTQLIR